MKVCLVMHALSILWNNIVRHTLETIKNADCILIIVSPSRSSPRNKDAHRKVELSKGKLKMTTGWMLRRRTTRNKKWSIISNDKFVPCFLLLEVALRLWQETWEQTHNWWLIMKFNQSLVLQDTQRIKRRSKSNLSLINRRQFLCEGRKRLLPSICPDHPHANLAWPGLEAKAKFFAQRCWRT